MKHNIIFLILILFVLVSCGGSGGAGGRDSSPDSDISASDDYEISDEEWDETAVRKVLHAFAFGGFATDEQITEWAALSPREAIIEMITFNTANDKLSPQDDYDSLTSNNGTLWELANLWASSNASNKTEADNREDFETDQWNAPGHTWMQATNKRGLNPVRQKIGLFETNYHLAINQNVHVSNRQVFTYYDTLMDLLAEDKPYQDVLAWAGTSAAVATQYNHKENLFIDARFEGNEDFAREYHQLFFGILGDYDPDYHELTTIRNTAKALTDMDVDYITTDEASYWSDEISYGTQYHYPGSLDILNTTIEGETAWDKLFNLAQTAIEHEESLENLPLIIVRALADDNITDEKAAKIQNLWQSMPRKSLLSFIRAYAISSLFHDENRIKYLNSFDRHLIISNRLTLNNLESYAEYYQPEWTIWNEEAEIFRPQHDVFGGQTGLEASDSANIFKSAYDRSVQNYWTYARNYATDDAGNITWLKDWASVIPADNDGNYKVKAVAEWLWNRFVADGLKNFGTLERAHVYSLLGSSKDFATFVDPNNPEAVYSTTDIENNTTINELYSDMQIANIDLNSDIENSRLSANQRVGLAIAFIAATPYAFAQEGK